MCLSVTIQNKVTKGLQNVVFLSADRDPLFLDDLLQGISYLTTDSLP